MSEKTRCQEPIKVKNKSLIKISQQIVGYRVILDNMAVQAGNLLTEFWKLSKELYPETDFQFMVFDHEALEFKDRRRE